MGHRAWHAGLRIRSVAFTALGIASIVILHAGFRKVVKVEGSTLFHTGGAWGLSGASDFRYGLGFWALGFRV